MGCSNAEVKEEKNEEKNEEKKEEEIEKSEKEEEESYDFDKKTREYFSNFEDKEISLILSRKKSINKKNNFCFLYSKLEVIYNDKFLNKKNQILCTELLVSYINPKYIGNFGYESQISGFFPKKVKLNQCYIKDNKIDAKMINNGKFINIFQIDENNKQNLLDDIMIIEFTYNITQIKNYGIRLIKIEYNNNDLLSYSIRIKYDSDTFSIKSYDKPTLAKDNEFYIFDKKNLFIILVDKDNIISINDKGNKLNKIINTKFTEEEITEIDNCLKNINIKPLEPNLIYEKIIHELHSQKDYIEGTLLIFQPSFEKYYFDLFKIVTTFQEDSHFKIKELKINDKTIINLNKSETYKKSDDYYKWSKNSYSYNISTKDDFILFEFHLVGNASKEDKKTIKYNFDPKNIFNLFFSKGTYYSFEIILNGQEISFGNDKEYNCEKTEEKITFKGNWELDDNGEEKSEEYLPKEITLKTK